jgi:hypothetical protein
LILNSTGLLALSNAEDNLQVPLASSVEQFWVANYTNGNFQDDTDKDIGNTLWAYGEAGLQVYKFVLFFSESEVL